jgi:hypothetical protein
MENIARMDESAERYNMNASGSELLPAHTSKDMNPPRKISMPNISCK